METPISAPAMDAASASEPRFMAETIDKIKAQRGGRFLNLYRTLAHSPTVCEGWLGLFTAIRQKAKLDGASRQPGDLVFA